MDSEDDMHDAAEVESLDDFYSGDTALASEDDEADYEFLDNESDDSDSATIRRPQQNYTILSEADIHLRQEDDITRISTVLSIPRVSASILLRYYNWSVNKVNDEWFVDEEKVRKAVGLPDKPVVEIAPTAIELTCGICFETYLHRVMHAAVCGHHFCTVCWRGYMSTSINDGPGCLMLRCPDPACGAAVGQGMINLLASNDDKEKYSRYLLRSYIEDNRKVSSSWFSTGKIPYNTQEFEGKRLFMNSCRIIIADIGATIFIQEKGLKLLQARRRGRGLGRREAGLEIQCLTESTNSICQPCN